VIRHRLGVFDEATAPLIDYYHRERGLLRVVDASRSADEVTVAILAELGVDPDKVCPDLDFGNRQRITHPLEADGQLGRVREKSHYLRRNRHDDPSWRP